MTKSAHKFLAALLLAAPLVAASLPAAKPEDVGMSRWSSAASTPVTCPAP